MLLLKICLILLSYILFWLDLLCLLGNWYNFFVHLLLQHQLPAATVHKHETHYMGGQLHPPRTSSSPTLLHGLPQRHHPYQQLQPRLQSTSPLRVPSLTAYHLLSPTPPSPHLLSPTPPSPHLLSPSQHSPLMKNTGFSFEDDMVSSFLFESLFYIS